MFAESCLKIRCRSMCFQGHIYYTDPLKPETQPWWDNDPNAPVEWSWELATVPKGEENEGKPYFINKRTKESSWTSPESLAWKKLLTEYVFYYNTVTGASSSTKPAEMGVHSEEHNRTYWIDKKTNEAVWESEHWWTEVKYPDDDPQYAGKTYWVQEMTREVSATKPEAMGWVEWHPEVPNTLKDETFAEL